MNVGIKEKKSKEIWKIMEMTQEEREGIKKIKKDRVTDCVRVPGDKCVRDATTKRPQFTIATKEKNKKQTNKFIALRT